MKYKKTYSLTMTFEERNHSIVESWKCKSFDSLKKTLCDALDLAKDRETGFAVEPKLEKIEESLRAYADDKFIKEEFNRQKKAHKLYLRLVGDLMSDCLEASGKLDKQTHVLIEVS